MTALRPSHYMCVCVCPQALLLHGSLPEEDQDGSVGFGDNRPNAEQQLVQCPLSANSRKQHSLATLCEASVSSAVVMMFAAVAPVESGYCTAQLSLSDVLTRCHAGPLPLHTFRHFYSFSNYAAHTLSL